MRGFWKKAEYFWMYYKIPFLTVIAIAVVIIYFGYAKLTEKEYALNAMLLDVHTNVSEETLEKDFAQYAEIDLKECEVEISASWLLSDSSSGTYALTSLSRFQTQIGTEELDVALMLEEDFETYAEADCFLDLSELFTEEELETFPSLFIDKDGRVLGIYADELAKIQEIEGYSDEDTKAVAGVIYNTQRADMAKCFLEYLNIGS